MYNHSSLIIVFALILILNIMYKYIFGPVPSRRLGMSLGVDLVPNKICTLDCVYCEVGKTTKLTLERKEYYNTNYIIEELIQYLDNNAEPDYITMSGSGEPTLNINIGKIIQAAKSKKPNIPVAVITNGTLLSDKNVRDMLLNADLVLPSLDSALIDSFKKINRPHKDINLDDYIQGLVDFRQEFKGKIWLEVFILPEYNDSEQDILALKEAIIKIKPDSVQINTLDRPGTVTDLRPATSIELQNVIDILGFDNIEIITSSQKNTNNEAFRNDISVAILETISRRPCTLEDLGLVLNLSKNELNKYLSNLERNHKIEAINLKRGVFYQLTKK